MACMGRLQRTIFRPAAQGHDGNAKIHLLWRINSSGNDEVQ